MKRFVFILSILFCTTVFAHTIKWYSDNNLVSTTTCESGDNITPPTVPEKFGYHFVRWVDYTPIEYLESTGRQWIDTGITAGSITQMSIKASLVNLLSSTTIYIFGAQQGDIRLYFLLKTNQATFTGAGNIPFENNTSIFELNAYINSQNKWVLSDGNNTSIGGGVAAQPSLKIWLFGNNYNNTLDTTAPLKIYDAKIYDNNILVRDFIPVLDKNGTPCMYDKVEGKFYYNAGTGNFIAGPVIGE